MRDELLTLEKPQEKECGIFNLNKSNQSGSHWVAWIYDSNLNLKIYFDSYGDSPPPIEFVNYIGAENLKYTSEKFQSYNDPPVCGHLCIKFLNNYKKFL